MDRTLAWYAANDDAHGGRDYDEPRHPPRSAFSVDRHRVLSCTAFRRLEQKTQVFAPKFHDHFRTRLTHTLEAADVARCLAVALRANEDLAETITLAHDIGHPPFGHAGEAALNEMMAEHGGFNHNAHALRVVEYLEHPYPAFRGLNLTRAVRQGLAAHASTYDVPSGHATDIGWFESEVASLADRIAYDCHDLEDAIGAELVNRDDVESISLWCEAEERCGFAGKRAPIHAIRRPVLDAIIARLLVDVVRETEGHASRFDPHVDSSCRRFPVTWCETTEQACGELEKFLRDRVYLNPTIEAQDRRGRGAIRGVFEALLNAPQYLPERFRKRIDNLGPHRVICDYIAGMTDRFCRREMERLGIEAG